jgi:hypothetical protein
MLNDVSNVPFDRIYCYILDIHSCVDLDDRACDARDKRITFDHDGSRWTANYLQFRETLAIVRTQVTLKLVGLTRMTVDMILKVLQGCMMKSFHP